MEAAAATVAVALALVGGTAASPAHAQTITAVTVATGLNFPAGFTFTPDGRIFTATASPARSTSIRGPRRTRCFHTVSNVSAPGLTGLALHPDYPSRPYLLVR
jgi:glucose/arabinose dehydrogenase